MKIYQFLCVFKQGCYLYLIFLNVNCFLYMYQGYKLFSKLKLLQVKYLIQIKFLC